jgi:hypothetical protein
MVVGCSLASGDVDFNPPGHKELEPPNSSGANAGDHSNLIDGATEADLKNSALGPSHVINCAIDF